MPFHELIQIGETNGGVILPKSELRAEGLLEEDGSVVDGQQLKVTQVEEGAWEIEKVEAEGFAVAD